MKNFSYLQDIPELATLYKFCDEAECSHNTNADVCALNCRRALEWIIRAIYAMKHIHVDSKDSLYTLMSSEPFTEFLDDSRQMMAAHFVRKVGNKAAHTGGVKGGESFFCLLNLYNLVGGVLLKLGVLKNLAPFDKALIPQKGGMYVIPEETPMMVAEGPTPALPEREGESAMQLPKEMDKALDYTEAETRKLFIDLMLEEAGWDVQSVEGALVPSKACIEVEVNGMPTDKGIGYADYVLFGANGKPLAVVEAKRTTKDPAIGKHQAELYADCLEKQYGVRPVIYYTNGYTTYIIDGLGYPPRLLFGFHTEDELQVLIQRRGRQQITDLKVKDYITDREYQKRAIKSVCEHFNSNHRRGLIVMATGTGKTRVAISLSDVLIRNGWAKNILFLADRTALVNQAKKNFVKLLPDSTYCVLSENKDPDKNARIMFSTYQTMINYIDTDDKEFSIGRFDLIIIDEAHRSVFGKYTAIFDYFDSLIVGLTATPRDEVEKSTYDLFQMETGEPNFAYELEEAVEDGYLVDYSVQTRTTDILKNGIKYSKLTKEEKKQMESIWKYEAAKAATDVIIIDEEAKHRDIESKEIFKYIFNTDTVDKVIVDLMENGLKVQGGDLIGKTIIFGYNHQHADLIVKRFNVLYPEYGADFCVLIDNYVKYAQDLINNFEVRENLPQIAVSVDMLDTGIDVPDILNLVFFKPIHSYIKFWQMIGRGTRLSQGIFDDGSDKNGFIIFDWCGNFEYFDKHPKGKEQLTQISLTERLFGLQVDLAVALQHQKYQEDEFAKKLHDDTKKHLHSQVVSLNDHHISVRQKWQYVDKYRKEESWTYVSSLDAVELKDNIAPLVVSGITDEGAKKYDILLTNIELSYIDADVNAEGSKIKVEQISQALEEKASIPQVAAKMDVIKEVADHKFWETATLSRLEYVRKEIRELVKFILGTDSRTFTINIKDTMETIIGTDVVLPRLTYKQRIIDYLAKNKDLPVIQKIFNLEKLSGNEIIELERICWRELGTKEEYDKYVEKGHLLYGDCVAIFIRSMIGVDRIVALQMFSKFLSDNTLNSMQEEYIKTIISYVCENGDITTQNLIEDAPFCDYDWVETFGEKLISVRNYVNEIHEVVIA
ncbi:MAG: DEAD/DEAH box helicase family protein [Bacteroidaceae bacterium]|nr:DEAD/DEAH box helicase family protein [Bacteroidaceae bacterium]